MADIEALFEQLTNAYGPSGYEGPVRKIMREHLTPIADDIEVDGIGSIIARLNGSSESPRIMLAAHMDEVGALVRYVTDDGFVMFQTIGGWLDTGLINQRWAIITSKGIVNGITGMKTPHVMSADERSGGFKREDMFIDVGATSKQDAEERLGLRPGDPIAPDSKYTRLNGGDTYLGKAWDDRIGCIVMIEVLRALKGDLPPNTVFGAGTVQEEIGLRGAQTASYIVKPDIGITLESGVAGDYPGITQYQAQEKIGAGPGVFFHDTSMLPNLKLRDFVEQVGKDLGITVQHEVLSGYGQDGAEMQRAHGGAPAVNISVPVRYLHNHNGIIHKRDVEQAIQLVTALVKRLDSATVAELKTFD